LFARRKNAELIEKSYIDFCQRLRWRLFFLRRDALSGLTEIENNYDPDYDLHKPRKKELLADPEQYIEDGLDAGRTYIKNYISSVVPSIESHAMFKSHLDDIARLKSICEEQGYIITITDKNLGVAVVTRQWYIEGAIKLLNDTRNYRKLTTEERSQILTETVAEMESIAELASDAGYTEQLTEFLISKCPAAIGKPEPSVPQFYGIPKIHKTPVKYRPIVPCHSSAQAPAGKFVSKMLKPIVDRCRYVIKGTKHLAQLLSKLELDTSRKVWIVSGDIEAFYPNIPLKEAIDLMLTFYNNHYKDASPEEREVFRRCLVVANSSVIMDFQGQCYEQLDGLAMGQAPSPDIANLWGAYFEEHAYGNNPDLR
jgi:hypothetical protein